MTNIQTRDIRTAMLGVLAVGLLIAGSMTTACSADLTDTILPDSTMGVLTITNGEKLSDQWNKTQLASLLNDPVMEPFRDDLQRQFEEKWTKFRQRLGVTLDDISGVPSGETAMALTRAEDGTASLALLMDVTDRLDQASEFLDKIAEQLLAEGAKQSSVMIHETQVNAFELPKEKPEDPQLYAYYFLSNNVIGAADKPETIGLMLAKLQGEAGPTLGQLTSYQTVMARCAQDMPEGQTPQIRWFIRPFEYAQTIRHSLSEADQEASAKTFELLQSQGFTAVQSVGGYVDFAVDGFEMVNRAYVYAPKPWAKAMNMLVLENKTDFTPQAWVPRNVAKYTAFHIDPMAVFDNVGSIFDQVVGQGEEGIWIKVLESLKTDPEGPMIDLKTELFEQLTGRVSTVLDYEKPITPTSERMVIAIEVKDEAAVAIAVEKLLKDDGGDVQQRIFEDDIIIWETIPLTKLGETDGSGDSDTMSAQELHDLGLGNFGPDIVPRAPITDEEPVEPFFPDMAICVARGHLFIASELGFLVEILESKSDERDTLAGTIDYQVIQVATEDLGGKQGFLRSFARTDESYRPGYEMIRQGKLAESDMVLNHMVKMIFPSESEGELRETKIDGSKMPEFDTVRRYFGPGGMFGIVEEDGWFFKGFLLSK